MQDMSWVEMACLLHLSRESNGKQKHISLLAHLRLGRSHDSSSGYVHAAIMVDGTSVALSIADQRHGYYSSTGKASS